MVDVRVSTDCTLNFSLKSRGVKVEVSYLSQIRFPGEPPKVEQADLLISMSINKLKVKSDILDFLYDLQLQIQEATEKLKQGELLL